jgi:hypothetical protein
VPPVPWELIEKGGPWALFFFGLASVVSLMTMGVLVTGKEVDRTIAGYVDSLNRAEKELEFWRAAAQAKDATIATQASQVQRLMAYSAVGTHALEGILEEAKRREVAT